MTNSDITNRSKLLQNYGMIGNGILSGETLGDDNLHMINGGGKGGATQSSSLARSASSGGK